MHTMHMVYAELHSDLHQQQIQGENSETLLYVCPLACACCTCCIVAVLTPVMHAATSASESSSSHVWRSLRAQIIGAMLTDPNEREQVDAYIADRALRGLRAICVGQSADGGATWQLVGLIRCAADALALFSPCRGIAPPPSPIVPA